MGSFPNRLSVFAIRWRVAIHERAETASSCIAFGERDGAPVVLKVAKREHDEWRSGEILSAWNGRGAVRCLEHQGGAMLMDRIVPGTPLVSLTDSGRDDEACEIIAQVVERLPAVSIEEMVTASDWGGGFDRYLESDDAQLDRATVELARAEWRALCATQSSPRLLHGDLQQYDVPLDAERGWLAIDPKSVVAEGELELAKCARPSRGDDARQDSAACGTRGACYSTSSASSRGERESVLSPNWSIEDRESV